MKPKEFKRIKKAFKAEQKRWKSLKSGDVIYESVARGFDMDYHKMTILDISIEDRYVTAREVSIPDRVEKVYSFLTEEEFTKMSVV